MSLDWPLGCPPEAHRSRAGYLHTCTYTRIFRHPTFCAAPKTPSQSRTPIFPAEASPYSFQYPPARCFLSLSPVVSPPHHDAPPLTGISRPTRHTMPPPAA
eukprot:scaffold10887_cov109-Isochrysis_galbana.AAC.3